MCLEIPDLFLVLNMISHSFAALTREISCTTLEISLIFPRTHVLFSLYIYTFHSLGNHSKSSQRHSCWKNAQSNCQDQNSQLFQLDYAYGFDVNNIPPNQSYWLGLSKKINANEESCTVATVGDGTNVTDYRLNRCLLVQCSDFTIIQYGRCNGVMYRPICIKDAEISSQGALGNIHSKFTLRISFYKTLVE